MNIAVIPDPPNLLRDEYFRVEAARDGILEPYAALKAAFEKRGERCHTVDMYSEAKEIDCLIFSRLDREVGDVLRVAQSRPDAIFVYIAHESPLICPMHTSRILGSLPIDAVLTWNRDAYTQYEHILKCNIPQPHMDSRPPADPPFETRLFCCMIASNKHCNAKGELYSERMRALAELSRREPTVDLYGRGWETSRDKLISKIYRGWSERKRETYTQYRFGICFENVGGERGYVTEKIFDCLGGGCVPVYIGAPDIQEHVPKECFIDLRDFCGRYDELKARMLRFGKEEYELHRKAVDAYLLTDSYASFGCQTYAGTIVETVATIAKKRNSRRELRAQLKKQILRNALFYFTHVRRMRRYLTRVFWPPMK